MLQNKFLERRKYSLKRSAKVFFQIKELLLRKKKKISVSTYEYMKSLLLEFETALEIKDSQKAYDLREKVLLEAKNHLKKNLFDLFNEWVLGIGFILLTVTLVNQLWFQHYQIPSGSMRPTLMEKDRLFATKTNFGINFPFKRGHLHFNPRHLQRGNIVILQNHKLPKEENMSRYLFVFPTRKQFVKRLIGKPGDTLYFYGGKIYGVDQYNQEITEFHDSRAFETLEHIPFHSFEGTVLSDTQAENSQIHSPVYLYQMDQLIGKFYVSKSGSFKGKFYNGTQWTDESPNLSYEDLWGIKNYAMARILTQEEAKKMGATAQDLQEPFVLEFQHSPHINFPRPHLGMDLEGRLRPKMSLEKSFLPIDAAHMKKIQSALYTARFVVKNGFAGNYSMQKSFTPNRYSPKLEGIPDGTYEFINGVAYSVTSSGRQIKLSSDHPLNQLSASQVKTLFNLGMQMLSLYEPSFEQVDFQPSRYAYFREGDLYLMGHSVFSKQDPALATFVQHEKSKARSFIDHGPPMKDGKLDKEFILNYGLRIPKNQYLFLGDNHAGSKDCRAWGFISEENIQGSPAVILWPPSSRVGLLNQNKFSFFNGSTFLVTFLGLSMIIGSILFSRKQRKRIL